MKKVILKMVVEIDEEYFKDFLQEFESVEEKINELAHLKSAVIESMPVELVLV